MGRWTDLVPRQEHTTQQRSPRRARPSKFIIHTADGYFEGTISWQKGPNGVSSHFISGKNQGEVAQMADTEDEAWTQSDANRYSISSENAGFGERGEALTAWQLEINAQLLARAHREYPDTLPLRLMSGPDESGLGWHGMGGNPWGGHFGCPGEAIKAQLPQILNRAIEIVNGDDMTPEREAELFRSVQATELTLGSFIQGFPQTIPLKGADSVTKQFPIVPNQQQARIEAKLDGLLEAVAHIGSSSPEVGAILAGVDERLKAQRAAIEADTRDAVADALEGGAPAVRADA